MSYILDALKKSDQERKQGDVPNLQTVHVAVAPEQNNPWIMYALILFLLMALAFVIGIMMSDKKDSGLSSDDNQEPLTHSNVKAVVSLSASTREKIDGELVEPESAMVMPAIKSAGDRSPPAQKVKSALVGMNNPQTKQLSDINDIPYLSELDDFQQQRVPEMSFAGHVYSSVAASRSVIINGRLISEGETLMPGMSVEKITNIGVVFRFNDLVFRVDVLQDWSFE